MLPLHFAHANGFPADTYRRLFEALQARGFDKPVAIPQMGHQPEHPVTDGWHHLVDELCHYLEHHCPVPVVGVGHSFGAVVTLMAAHRRPELFHGVIMLEPPLAMGLGGILYRWAKTLGQVERISPAGKSRHRRQTWPDIDSAVHNLADKSLFRGIPRDTVRDYVCAATRENKDGERQLSYEVDVECEIFNTLPHHLGKLPPCPRPGLIVRGSDSAVTRSSWTRTLARRQGFDYEELEGGHLFPLQHPDTSAERIARFIRKIGEDTKEH
ncbi:MAG: alpha/beta fold hydrolase [Pseudomonadota bacterium]